MQFTLRNISKYSINQTDLQPYQTLPNLTTNSTNALARSCLYQISDQKLRNFMVFLILLMSSLFIFARVSVDPDWDRSYHSVLELGRCEIQSPVETFKVHPFQDMNMLLSHHHRVITTIPPRIVIHVCLDIVSIKKF